MTVVLLCSTLHVLGLNAAGPGEKISIGPWAGVGIETANGRRGHTHYITKHLRAYRLLKIINLIELSTIGSRIPRGKWATAGHFCVLL